MPSPQPSPMGEGADYSRFHGCRQFEKQLGFTTVDLRSSEKQKAACTTCFSCRTLNSNSYPVLSPVGESQREGNKPQGLYLGRLGCWERLPRFGEYPLPNPPPRGRERVAAGFTVAGDLKSNLDLQPLISGRLKSKKQPTQPAFLTEPLTPTATPSSLPVGES